MNPEFTFAGPEGVTYAIALYSGCRDCSTPAGVVLYEIPSAQLTDEDSNWGPSDWRDPLQWVDGAIPRTREVVIPTARPDDLDAILRENDLEHAGVEGAYTDMAHRAFNEFREWQQLARSASRPPQTPESDP